MSLSLSPLMMYRWYAMNCRFLNFGSANILKNSFFQRRHNYFLQRTFFRRRLDFHEGQRLTQCFIFEHPSTKNIFITGCKFCSVPSPPKEPTENTEKKLSLVQRYKKMLKEYWYVLIPVHVVTSAFWFGSFYYAAKSGIDIVPFLEQLGVSDKYLAPLRSSSLGHIAVASAMYKLATPARYAVTLGGTTMSVNYLSKRGLLPSKDHLKQILKDKRDAAVNKFKSKS